VEICGGDCHSPGRKTLLYSGIETPGLFGLEIGIPPEIRRPAERFDERRFLDAESEVGSQVGQAEGAAGRGAVRVPRYRCPRGGIESEAAIVLQSNTGGRKQQISKFPLVLKVGAEVVAGCTERFGLRIADYAGFVFIPGAGGQEMVPRQGDLALVVDALVSVSFRVR